MVVVTSVAVWLAAVACVSGGGAGAGGGHKRAPSGFTGVRGKKSIEDTYPNTIADDPPLANGLEMPYIGNQIYPERNDLSNDLPKRAPSGFFGMRGKKEYETSDDLDKRAPSMGFLGMRGKKESENRLYDEQSYDKRAPNGFMGMRGKKFYEDIEKRVSNGFFGMRGKKQPGKSSFFGMRGKKYPYEFRGKFVGVRGKKDELGNDVFEDDDAYVPYLTNDLDLNQLLYLLANGNDFNFEKRKGPSGFLGMRG